jgi:hypothetical protein
LMTDFAIFGLIGSWPREFVFGSKYSRFVGPVSWRRKLGFQDTEIIVRKGRKWDTPLLTPDVAGLEKTWRVDEELTLKVKVEPAMRKSYVEKSGFLLLDKDYDLDYKAMLDAHRLLEKGSALLKDFDGFCMVYYQKQWVVWKVNDTIDLALADGPKDNGVDSFRRKLTDLGAEDVFFRWIEIVQFETSQPQGFTEGRQAEAMRELKSRLEKKGVDFAQFFEDIGGQAGLPGLNGQT